MSLTAELERLAQLHHSGALSAEEFAVAKQRLLAHASGAETDLKPIAEELARLQVGQQLAALDREWDSHRRELLVATRSGNSGPYNYQIPTQGMADAMRYIGVGIGTLWTIGTAYFVSGFPREAGPIPWILPLFGLIVAGMTWHSGNDIARRAKEYARAEADYHSRRAEMAGGASPVGTNGLPIIES